ncbi:MAG: methylmalonyl Co-A mutase-associated GTPase MeaB, partial [Dehalococcoidia bacterium]|nr:methylmalonyl Co-A mutase-associated GTPase MeaB [Dehalococcoidia bacterium]
LSGKAQVIGVTGSPGAGKSTLVNQLAKAYRAMGKTLGIIAVDPSSAITGGAILGDRIRMRDLTGDPGIFIRSMATRGALGGLARTTGEVITVLDAIGREVVIVETVGVGQDEVDIAKAAHTTVVVGVPGLGDEIQAIKAGVLEIADVFVVNKADREGSDRLVLELEMMLSMGAHSGWKVPILKTVAVRAEGIEEVVEAIQGHWQYIQTSGKIRDDRLQRAKDELLVALREEMIKRLLERDSARDKLAEMQLALAERKIDPYTAVERILDS